MSMHRIDDPSSFARRSLVQRDWLWAISIFCAALGILLDASPVWAQPTSEVFQLTSGNVFDLSPAVDGTTYVWRRGSGSFGEIYMWTEGDAEPTIISTDNEEYFPRISDGRVVWESLSGSGSDYDVYLWENGSAAPLFNNSDDERDPDVGGYGMVWRFKTWWLVYDNGQEQIEITADAGGIDLYPRVQDSFLVWEAGVNGNNEIYYWDNGTLVQLTNNNYGDHRPETDGTTVVWFAANGPSGSNEIMRWTPDEGTTQLTNNAVYDTQPDVSGDVVVFARDVGGNYEIFFRYFGVDYQITDNEFDDFEPAIDGDRVVWHGLTSGGVRHIYYAILSGLDGGSLPGACCTGMECSILTDPECDEIAGEFIGPETFCEVDTCPKSVQPAGGWWTYQHDAQRTGRTDAVVYSPPTRIWRLYTAELESQSPAIGPDGTIYVEGSSGLIAVQPDGSLRWSSLYQSRNTPAIRSDGHLFVPAVNSLSKIDHTDGSAICETGNTTEFATVIDPEGNCIYCIGDYCRQVSPGCDEQWTTSEFTVASHPVLDHDGGIYIAGHFAIIRIDPLSGNELWSFATSGSTGDPVIGADNSIYCTVEPNMVLALNPDGSEQWTAVLADYGTEGSVSPAIAADGTLYVVGQVPPGFDHLLVALSPAGDELWRFTEPNSGDPQAPVIDGNGTILFSMRNHQYLVALAPEDGSELWRVGVGGDPLIETNDYASGPINIPVETDAEHTITIEDEGIVLDLNVQIRVLHERVGDLRIMLTHLDTSVIILDRVCGDYSDFACTLLDDEADWIIEEHCESGFCATYQPGNPLSAFDGMPLAGDWILTIEDLEPGNTGTFEDWFLQIEAVLGLDDAVRSSPAIGEDGTIYVTTARGFLVALGAGCPEPDPVFPPYSYRLVATLGTNPRIETNDWASGPEPLDLPVDENLPPAEHTITIEHEADVLDVNVQIRVLHEQVGDLRIILSHLETSVVILDQICGEFSDFACTMLDDEADWIIEEHCENGFCATYHPSNHLSAFNGMPLAGDWTLTVEDLEPGNSGTFEEWFMRIEEVIELPAIQEFEQIEIGDDGLVSFQARVSPGDATASIRELGDGSFSVFTEGTVIDGAEIDSAFLARVDAAGTPYMPANILKLGTAAFVNEVMVIHEQHVPFVFAPVLLHDFEPDFFDIKSPVRFRLYGREDELDPLAMLLVNSENNSVETVLAIGDQIDAISRFVDFDNPTHHRLLNTAGEFVITTGDLILNGTEILYAGSPVESEALSGFDLPQIGENGTVHFLADGDSGRGVYGLEGRRLGAGDVIGEFEIADIERYDVNTNDQLACGATLTDNRPAVFTESKIVVVPDATMIGGAPVDDVNVGSMAQNNSDQIAFIARVDGAWGAYVATPSGVPEAPFTYRKALEVGDAIGKGVIVQGLQELNLSQEGLITASVELGSTPMVAPLQVFNVNRMTHFFINNTGMFTGSVIPNQSDPVEIALISTSGPSITPLLTVGDTIDGFQISSFVYTEFEQHIVNDSGQLVVMANGPLGRAVLTPDGVVLQTGDVIEGDELVEILSAEINGLGDIIVWARHENGQDMGYAVYTETVRLIGSRDVIDGHTISEVRAAALNDAGNLAVNLQISTGRKAVYVDASQVLMESETEINGQVVGALYNSNRVRLNNAGQVAFHAALSGDPVGRLYTATPTGIPESPYTYRHVVAEGDVLDGVTLNSIKDFQLTDAGLITIWDDPPGSGPTSIFIETSEGTFEAYTTGDAIAGLTMTDFKTAPRVDDSGTVYINGVVLGVGTVVFVDGVPIIQSQQVTTEDAYLVETSEGVFDGLFQGQDLDGLEINFNYAQRKAPRMDADGNVYVYCGTQEAGATLFRNGQALVQEDVPGATAPVLLSDWPSDIRVLDVNDDNHVLLYGHHLAGEESGLILVNALTETAELLFAEGVVHPEWNVESIDHSPLDERHSAPGSRTFVVRGEGRVAVLSDSDVLAIDGRVVGGKTLTDFHSTQTGGNGSIFFIAEFDGGNGLFTAFEQIAATGDVVDGYTIASIEAQSVSAGISAYTGILDDGRTGVFRGDIAVAVEEDTLIDGQPVTAIDPLIVRKGEAEAVAFVATTKLWTSIVVASGPDGGLTYRTAAAVGEIIEGREVLSLADVRLNHEDLVSFRSGDTPENTTLFRETNPGVFTTIVDGDELAGLTIDFTLGYPFAPRVDENGHVFLSLPVTPVGQLVFIDGQPIAHMVNEGPKDDHISIADFTRFDYVDPNDQGQFVVYGRQEATDPPSLLAVDPIVGSITPLVSHGQIIEDFAVDNLDPAFVDGYGDDGVVLFRASNFSAVAIATNNHIVAREGDEIDGRILLDVEKPRRNADGWLYYLGEHALAGGRSIFFESPEGLDAFGRGVGDTVAGQPILSVSSFAVNNQNNLAYVAQTVGAGGVFVDDQPVAVVNISRIDGQLVTGVGAQVSINESHQIAFIANLGGGPAQLYVATFDSDLEDCNENDIPDCEDLQAGTGFDCNANGLLDECDIDEGESEDNNANGVPDECDCQVDLDGDGSVGAFDLALLLGSWGACPGCPADIDGNGVVNAFDLAQLLGSWGPC